MPSRTTADRQLTRPRHHRGNYGRLRCWRGQWPTSWRPWRIDRRLIKHAIYGSPGTRFHFCSIRWYAFSAILPISKWIPHDIWSALFSRYEFLWTRTRAIRKDITQQRLCSLTIVAIIEKITRFHIWCAARLVDQSTDAFDPRINSENLTQCLQTLKELYNDLDCADDSDGVGGDKEASVCPREPEFRAYMILMKLNDNSMLE